MDWRAISETGRVLAFRTEEWIRALKEVYGMSRGACNISLLGSSDRELLDHAAIALSQLDGQDDWRSFHRRLQEAGSSSELSSAEFLDLLSRIENCVGVVRGLQVVHHHLPAELVFRKSFDDLVLQVRDIEDALGEAKSCLGQAKSRITKNVPTGSMTRDRPINRDVIRTLKEHLGKLDILLTCNLRTAYLALEENSQRLRELLILEAQPGNIANDFEDPYNKSSGNPAEKLAREKPMIQALEPGKQDPPSSVSNSEEGYMHVKPENDSLRSPSPESSIANGTGDIREDDTNNAVESNSRAGTMDDGGPKHISTMEINKPQARRLMKPFGGQIDGLQSVGYEYDPNSLSASVRILTPKQLVGFAKKLKASQLRAASMAKTNSGNSLFDTITIDLNSTLMHAFPQEVVQVLQDVTERLLISSCGLSSLPQQFANFKMLCHLDLSHNNISIFPVMLCEITSLEVINVSHNQIEELPTTIYRFAKLRVLICHHNKIKDLPLTALDMPALQVLGIHGNPLISPLQKIVQAKPITNTRRFHDLLVTSRIKDYLQSRVAMNTAPNSTKVMRHPFEYPFKYPFEYPFEYQPGSQDDTVDVDLEVATSSKVMPELKDVSFSLGWDIQSKHPEDEYSLFRGPIWIRISPLDTRETIHQTIRASFFSFCDPQDLICLDLQWLESNIRIAELSSADGKGFKNNMRIQVMNGGYLESPIKQLPVVRVQPFIFVSRGMISEPHLHEHLPLLKRGLELFSIENIRVNHTGYHVLFGSTREAVRCWLSTKFGIQGFPVSEIRLYMTQDTERDIPPGRSISPGTNPGTERILTEASRSSSVPEDSSMLTGLHLSIFSREFQESQGRVSPNVTSVPIMSVRKVSHAESGQEYGTEASVNHSDDKVSILDAETSPRSTSESPRISIDSTPDAFEAATTYSAKSNPEDAKRLYLRAFCDQLRRDLSDVLNDRRTLGVNGEYLESAIQMFAVKLHAESSNPFQWEASVTLHKKRREIAVMLSRPNEENACIDTSSAGTSEVVEEGEDRVPRAPFARPHEMTLEWLHDLTHLGNHVDSSSEKNTPSANDGDNPLFQHANYEQFVRGSGAYQWLLSKLRQHDQLTCENNSCLNEFGSRIRTHLGAEGYGRKLSRRKPLATVTIKFVLNWNPQKLLQRVEFDFQSPEKIRNMLCMTGTPNGAQALTVAEYMAMVWPGTWEPLVDLITKLITIPEGHMCVNQMVKSHPGQFKNIDHQRLSAQIQGHSSCLIQVSGGVHFVSEIAEQIGWLASAMTCPSSMSRGSVVTCRPMMTSLQRAEEATAAYTDETWKCHLTFAMDSVESEPQNPSGFCWRSLLWNTVLIQGYPIQSRAVQQTGLEISLKNLAICIRSQQIVRWNDRIIMKGFGSLVVATLLTAGLVVWHLLDSGDTEKRISYVDPKIDKLDLHLPQGFDLRSLERCRHVVGWCASATDMCGHWTSNLDVGSCGLPRPPASIIIDRLYIEGGSGAIGGLSMAINKKQQPFWLEREKDYPSLLRWASLQPIVFYDVSTRQAWLIDGASALLQLVRISLHLDENDPESTYDWVFNSDQLKDRWHGCSGRQAALRTLKSWDNLTLNLYVISKRLINGKMTTEYATLEQRVKSILHSLEILIDRQVQVASQEGISLPQSLNFHHSIAGFDILDVISPLGPIVPCSQNLETSGRGWKDLVSAIGVTTIFGRGFGNLIRPNDSSPICDNWTSVPIGQDYMAASVSTLKMLYERRMCRLWPGLRIGELTSKIMWLSALPHRPCNCSNPGTSRRTCSHDPVQFIVSKRAWNIRSMTKQMTPVDVAKLDNAGAFIFGHVSARRVRGDEWQDATGEEQGTELGDIPTDSSTSSAPVRNRPHAPSLSTTTSAAASATTPPTSTTTPSREDSQESGSNRLDNASEDRHSMADDTTGRGTKKTSKIVQRIRGMF